MIAAGGSRLLRSSLWRVVSFGVWGGLSSAEASIDSIAVLPFENVTGDAEVGYLSDGISESLLNSLTQLPDVKVISRSSASAAMKQSEDPREIGAKLGVRALVMGACHAAGGPGSWSAPS